MTEIITLPVICVCCDTECDNLDGIKCKLDHWMCDTCSETYLKIVMSEPELQIPLNCQKCNGQFEYDTIDKQLKLLDIEEKFNNLLMKYSLRIEDNEIVVECPFCDYLEIRDSIGINFIFCKKPICCKVSCYYCHLECNNDEEKHFDCASHGCIKKEIDEAIENGLKVSCPVCETGGRKDEDSCTHMTCIKCSEIYCYICGLSCTQFEGADSDEDSSTNFNHHNSQWEYIDTRCPMYFNDINNCDEDWPCTGCESDLVDFFHRKKILKNLYQVFERNDIELIREMEDRFKWLEKSDISIKQVLNENLELIKRKDPNES
jgi:hypothetical protein